MDRCNGNFNRESERREPRGLRDLMELRAGRVYRERRGRMASRDQWEQSRETPDPQDRRKPSRDHRETWGQSDH